MALTDKLTAIGDAIRSKTGTADLIPLADMPEQIRSIEGGGYDEVYEKGKTAAMQAFSDAYQNNGDRTNYYQAFVQAGWSDETFAYIRHPVVCTGGDTNANSVFYRSQITRIHVPVILKEIPATETFYYATRLEEIDSLTLIDVTRLTRVLNGCAKLRHMIIGGSIDVDFTVASSPELDEETVQSIIDHLKDLTGLETQTLTFHATVGEKLTEEQKAAVTAKNWTLAY